MGDFIYYGASVKILKQAKELRNLQTPAEAKLWKHLKTNKLNGLSFRRQHPINRFIADFYCHKLKLVIEVDGSAHNIEEVRVYDKERENILQAFNLDILRFTNEEIENSIEIVLTRIKEYANNKK
ncbi:MAG: endonuclease domain-containing protein [Candidatus Margulisiibacteriota bacterium]